jgi:hypothetical protein
MLMLYLLLLVVLVAGGIYTVGMLLFPPSSFHLTAPLNQSRGRYCYGVWETERRSRQIANGKRGYGSPAIAGVSLTEANGLCEGR